MREREGLENGATLSWIDTDVPDRYVPVDTASSQIM